MKGNSSNPLTEAAVKHLKPGTALADVGDHRGLRVSRGKTGGTTFYYRYRSPVGDRKIRQFKIGNYPYMSLAEARGVHVGLKAKRQQGICPVADRQAEDGKILRKGARKRKGQSEKRRTLESDPITALGHCSAVEVTPRQVRVKIPAPGY